MTHLKLFFSERQTWIHSESLFDEVGELFKFFEAVRGNSTCDLESYDKVLYHDNAFASSSAVCNFVSLPLTLKTLHF